MERYAIFMDTKVNIVKLKFLPTRSTDLMQFQSKSQEDFFLVEIDKLNLEFILKYRGCKIVKTILKKKDKVRGLELLGFKIYYKVTTHIFGTKICIQTNRTE